MGDYEREKLEVSDQCSQIILFNTEKSLLVREVAKTAAGYGIIIGEKKLWNTLREWGLIFKNSTEPKQHGINMGLFIVIEGVKKNYNYNIPFHTTRVTPKGQQYIINRLISEKC